MVQYNKSLTKVNTLAFLFSLFYLTNIFSRILMNQQLRQWVGVITVLFCLMISSCDDGIAPTVPESGGTIAPYGFKGIVDFKNWPAPESIVDLRVVAFEKSPPVDILSEVLSRRAEFTDTLKPYGADSIPYTLYLRSIPAGFVRYIVVAQQYGPNIQTDWRMLTFYNQDADTSRPDSLLIIADSVISGINLHVDFNSLPPQP
jgi:hypothetical protein